MEIVVAVVLVFYPWFRLHKVFSVFILMLHTRSSQGYFQLSTCGPSNAINIHFLMCPLCVATYGKWDVINLNLLICLLFMLQHLEDMMLSLKCNINNSEVQSSKSRSSSFWCSFILMHKYYMILTSIHHSDVVISKSLLSRLWSIIRVSFWCSHS